MNYRESTTIVSAQSMGADVTSVGYNCNTARYFAIEGSWTGTPNGTFSVEVSLDGSNWNAVSLSSSPAATGAAGSFAIDFTTNFPIFRVKYARTSSTGTLTVKVMAKE